MRRQWAEILVGSVRDGLVDLAALAPRVLAAMTIVLVGWLVAALARRVTGRLLRALDFDGGCARWGLSAALRLRGLRHPPSEVVTRLVFWTLLLVASLMAIEALQMPGTAGSVAAVVGFLPRILVAVLVVAGGWILAHFLAQAAIITAVNAQVPGVPLVAAAVRWLILVFAGAVALTQLGIAREMVLLGFGIAFGGLVLALALAFGLGARDLARQALERHLTRDAAREPDHLSHV
jgi:hypothetical protein